MCWGRLEQELIEGSDYSGTRLGGEGAGRFSSTYFNASKGEAPSVGFPSSAMENLWEDGSYTGVSRVDAMRQVCVAGSR